MSFAIFGNIFASGFLVGRIGKSLLFEYREDYAECFRLSHKINNKIQGGYIACKRRCIPLNKPETNDSVI